MPLLERPDAFPRWATVPSFDALSGQPNVLEPPGAKKNTGFHYREKPPRNWLNWLQNTNDSWLEFLDEQKQRLHSDYSFNAFETLPAVTAPGGLFVDVSSAVDVWLNGEKFLQPATVSSIPVAASNTSYIYLDTDRVYKATTSSDTATAANRLLVAKAVTSGVAVTSLVAIGRRRSQATHTITVGPGESEFTDLQRAIQHAQALLAGSANARVEILVNGALSLGAPITLDTQITIRGVGLGSIISWSFTNGAPITMASGSDFARIENLTFEYTGSDVVGTEHAAIRLQAGASAQNVRIRGCVFNGMMRAILINGTAIAGRWRILENDFLTSSTSALAIVGMAATAGACDLWHVARNTFQGPTAPSSTSAISLVNSPRSIVTENTIEGYNQGIVLDDDCDETLICHNVARLSRTNGIEVDSTGCVIASNMLDSCGADGGSQGGSIRLPTVTPVRCSIVDNFVRDWQAGFAISSAAGRTLITGNILDQVAGSDTSPAISGGIAVQDDHCNIAHNWIDLLVGAATGTGGKVNCYGIKCGLYGAGPASAFTVNGAENCVIVGNTIRNLGGSGLASGAVGIDAGQNSIVSDNQIRNVLGVCIRISDPDATVTGNAFTEYGLGPLVGPLAVAGVCMFFDGTADRCNVSNNTGRGPANAAIYPMFFDTGCVDCKLRGNLIQAGSAITRFPPNLHRQDYGTWEWIPETTTDGSTVPLSPALEFAPDEAYYVATMIRARRDATNAVAYLVQGIIATDGAGVPTIRTQTTTAFEGDQNLNAVYAIVGSTLVVNVTGAGGQTWVWRGSSTTEKTRLENTFYV